MNDPSILEKAAVLIGSFCRIKQLDINPPGENFIRLRVRADGKRFVIMESRPWDESPWKCYEYPVALLEYHPDTGDWTLSNRWKEGWEWTDAAGRISNLDRLLRYLDEDPDRLFWDI